MTFYDSHGKAIAYLHDDGIHIYLFNGRPVAYLYGDAVYGKCNWLWTSKTS